MQDQDVGLNDIVFVDDEVAFIVREEDDEALLYEPCLSLCRDEPSVSDGWPGLRTVNVGGVVMLHVG